MATVIIDTEKCIGCGSCAADCVSGCIRIEDGKATLGGKKCIGCGHCYAICPTGAVSIPAYPAPSGTLTPLSALDSEALLLGMKSRRSIRRFKPREVEREKLGMIIEAGRYSPTGSNAQDVAFTVLGSRQADMEKTCVDIFRRGAGLASPLFTYLKELNIDDSFFFKGAPLVIVVSARSGINAGLASAYMELMAESLGLGVLYSGFFVVCTSLSARLKKELCLPDGHKVHSCMVIGYPDVEYRRIPPRKEAKFREL